MQRTQLYATQLAMGARMVEFAGWELPIQFPAGPIAEHHAVRRAAGLFDISHMGQFELTGPGATAFLQAIQVCDVAQMGVYDAHYSLLLYADATIVDDIFLYRLGDERWWIVVNAANRAKDFAWLSAHVAGYGAVLTDISDQTAMLALQGPASEQILQRITPFKLSGLAARRAAEATIGGVSALIGRTGYTGEDGFELYFTAAHAEDLWQALLAAGEPEGLTPCGLAARDSLRTEAAMPLYGHEIDSHTNPLQARLGWAISWDIPFLGRDALLKAKLEPLDRVLVGFEMVDKAVPREGYAVAVDGVAVGQVTTGLKSPTLDKFIGMAYVPPHLAAIGTLLEIIVRGAPKQARTVKRPFYRPRYR